MREALRGNGARADLAWGRLSAAALCADCSENNVKARWAESSKGAAMKRPRRTFLQLAAAAAALPAVPRIARAQVYPTRPVRVIVPFPPGGATDIFARLAAQKLTEHFGKQFYIERRRSPRQGSGDCLA
jgi:hypothetical protein